jgi:hypothetical protein
MGAIKSRYINNRPPHHHPNAQAMDSPDDSVIYVTTHEKAALLTPLQTQEIFRHRHIVITGQDLPNAQFDRETLSKLGSLTALRQVQGMYCISPQLKLANSRMDEQSIL